MFNAGGSNLFLQLFSNTAAGGATCLIFGLGTGGTNGGSTLATNKFVTVRYQEDPAARINYCQAWDINGMLVLNQSSTYTSNTGSNSNGATVSSTGQPLS